MQRSELSPAYITYRRNHSGHGDGRGKRCSSVTVLMVSPNESRFRGVRLPDYSDMTNSGCCPGDVCVCVSLCEYPQAQRTVAGIHSSLTEIKDIFHRPAHHSIHIRLGLMHLNSEQAMSLRLTLHVMENEAAHMFIKNMIQPFGCKIPCCVHG